MARTIERLGSADVVRCESGISDDELAVLYAEAQVAVVPSLYEGFSLPAIEAMACGVPLVATTGGALPEVVGTDGETGLLVPPDDPEALAAGIRRIMDDPALAGPPGRRGPGPGARPLHLGGHGPGDGRAVPGGAGTERRVEDAAVLTVDYERLGVSPGREAARPGLRIRPARLPGRAAGGPGGGLRRRQSDEVTQVRNTIGAMVDAGEVTKRDEAGAVQGNALRLPFADGTFDRVIASEVLEHIPDDTGGHGRAVPGAAAGGDDGGHRAPLRARRWSTGPCPTNTTTCPGATSASTGARPCWNG